MSDEQSPPGLLSRYRSLGPGRQRRIMAISGGGSVGLGVGIALAWTLGIYQRANPQTINFSSAYPPMALTVFVVVIIAGLAIGLGVGHAGCPDRPPRGGSGDTGAAARLSHISRVAASGRALDVRHNAPFPAVETRLGT